MLNFAINESFFGNLNYLGIPITNSQSLTILILANVGSRYESLNEEGIAHFFEHIVFKGTKKFPTPQILATAVDAIGADFNAFTSKEYTGFYIKCLSKKIELGLEVLSEMMINPLMEEKAIKREKNVIKEEMRMYYDMPQYYIANIFERQFFEDRRLGHFVIGDEGVIDQIKQKNFINFMKKWYGANNLTLVLAGDSKIVNDPKTKSLVKKYFQKLSVSSENYQNYLIKKDEYKPNLHLEYRDTKQAHFVLGWPGLKHEDPEKYALKLLSVILGENMSSRLFTELREKRGLCYYIGSEITNYRDSGIFGASGGVNLNKVEEALKATINQFVQIVTKRNINNKELKRAKDFVLGKMILNLEDSQSLASFFGKQKLFLTKILNLSDIVNLIQNIGIDDIYKVAEKIIQSKKISLAIIGPYKNKEVFENILCSY